MNDCFSARRSRARMLVLAAMTAIVLPAAAGEVTGNAEQVYVWGMRADTIGRARSSSEGIVHFALFEDRPLLRPGELVEVVPGLAATQHSGAGKANQYFMRGFNLDHGTDFSVSLDGVPLNLPTHGHGQGYLDLNAIIPELVQTISYRQGPYFAEVGDFSSAGNAAMETFGAAPRTFIEFTGGKNDFYRALGTARYGGNYIAADLTYSDGPWVNPEGLRKTNLFGHFAVGGNWTVNAIAYTAKWNSSDQVPERAIDTGLIVRLGAIDTSDGGKSSRFILSARNREWGGWDTVVYAQKYDLNLWSNFTYFLDDPINGDQFEQADDRWVFGGEVARTWSSPVAGWTLSTGVLFRNDVIDKIGLYNTANRLRLATVREDSVNEWAGALWANGEQAFGNLRFNLGLRIDAIGADVSSDNPLNSGTAFDSILSPKLALAYLVSPNLELYANAGRGFHSNDARGSTATVSPKTGLPIDTVELIAPSHGAETGLRWNQDGFTATATLFWLHLDSELVFVGDAGDTESSFATNRLGGELLLDWHPIDRIDLNLSAATTEARYLGNPVGGDRIPNAIEYVITGGISALITDRLSTTLTFRYLGPAPLMEDDSVRSDAAFNSNFLIRYQLGRFTLTGQVLNLFNNAADDIQYFYTSRLPGEGVDGADDYHVHPMEPRSWRLSLRVAL